MEAEEKTNTEFKSFFYLLIIYAACVYVTYYTTSVVQQLLFASLILFFIRSKNNPFWIALFFILIDPPGGLFTSNLIGNTPTLPLYPFVPGIRDINFAEIFIIAMFCKALYIKKSNKVPLVFSYNYLLLYLLFLLILTFAIGVDPMKLLRSVRQIIPYTMLFSFPLLLKKQADYKALFYLIFPFCFVILFCQLYEILYVKKIVSLLGVNVELIIDKETGFIRAISSGFVVFLVLIGAMFYSLQKKNFFNRNYLYILIAISVISIFFSATRGWEIAIGVMLFLFFIIQAKNVKRFAISFFVSAISIFVMYTYIPVINKQINQSINKLTTVEKITEGDITAGGTLRRIDYRGPKVIKKFNESPVFGFGFSDQYWEYEDGHVGNQNLLLNGGIIGFSLFFLFWISFILKVFKIYSGLNPLNNIKTSLLIFILGIIGLLIIHSTSMQMFTYTIGFAGRGFLITFFFSMAAFYVTESKKLEEIEIY